MRRKVRRRFHQIFWAHLRRVQGRLILAALFTLGVTATELLKPWPLKMIVDHAILDKPLPHFLSFLSGIVEGSKITLVVEASCAIVLIAVCGGLFSYSQIFITSSIGYKMVYALRRELFAHLQRLSLSFHNRARSGDLLTKIAGDTNTLKDIFAEPILQFSSQALEVLGDRKSTRLNSSHSQISYAVFCLKKKKSTTIIAPRGTPFSTSTSHRPPPATTITKPTSEHSIRSRVGLHPTRSTARPRTLSTSAT